MFTGIIEEVGWVIAFTAGAAAWRLHLKAERTARAVALGDSVAVNGCCLTVTKYDETGLWFDVLEETRRLTNFAQLKEGSVVNLELSLQPSGRIGGHFVTGHIDSQGWIDQFEVRGKDHYLRVHVPKGFSRYLVYKGSVAIDGISLTVAEVEDDFFAVWLIPHTIAVTNLVEKKVGDGVNLEFDLLAKYVEKLISKTV